MELKTFERVCKVLREATGQPNLLLDTETRFDADRIDMDSLDLIEFAQMIEEEFNVELNDDEIEKAETVRQLADLIDGKMGRRNAE